MCVRVTRRDARAYIRPPVTQNETGRAVETKGIQGTPEGHRRDARAYIRPLCSAPSPTPATQKPPAERRRPRDTRGVHQVPRLPRKSHRQSGGDQWTPEGHRRDSGGKPGRPSDPFAVHQVPRLPRKSHAKATGRAVQCVWDVCVCVGDVCVSVCCVCLWDMCE